MHRKFVRMKLLFKALFTYFVEVVITVAVGFLVPRMRNEDGMYQVEHFGSWMMCACCAICIQLYYQPMMGDDLQRLRFLYMHQDKFEQTFIPFLINTGTLFMNVTLQVLSFYCTFVFQATDCIWAVMTYASLLTIPYINWLQYEAIEANHEIKKRFVDAEMCLPCERSIELADDLPTDLKLSMRQKAELQCVRVMTAFYHTFVFYFMPLFFMWFFTVWNSTPGEIFDPEG